MPETVPGVRHVSRMSLNGVNLKYYSHLGSGSKCCKVNGQIIRECLPGKGERWRG